jgi:transcriptional regulator with XRE-family HTH domain
MKEEDISQRKAALRKIREARHAKKMSLREFAQDVGLTTSYYTKVEGDRVRAAPETYWIICRALGFAKEEAVTLVRDMGCVDPLTSRLFHELYERDPVAMLELLRKHSA